MKLAFFLQNALELAYSNVEFKKSRGYAPGPPFIGGERVGKGVGRGRGKAWVGGRKG